MTLQYKLPKQEARNLPLSTESNIQAAKDFIRAESQISVPFKLRVHIRGQARYLKPERVSALFLAAMVRQTLERERELRFAARFKKADGDKWIICCEKLDLRSGRIQF